MFYPTDLYSGADAVSRTQTGRSFRQRVSDARQADGAGCTNRGSWPTITRLVARLAIGRITTGIDLIWRSSTQRHVRPMSIVPVDRQTDFAAEGALAQGHQRQTTEQCLERKDQSLDDRQAPVLADCAVSWRIDAHIPAPTPESVAGELWPLVAHDVAGCLAGCGDGLAEHSTHFGCGWLLEKHGIAHHPAGEMILGQGQPPGKGPTLRQGEREPSRPEAPGGGNCATYNNSAVPAAECVHRVVDAVEEALDRLQPAIPGPVTVFNRQFTYHVRRFDEAKEDAAVKSDLDRYLPKSGMLEACRKERKSMTPHRGEARRMRLQVIRLGDLALVGIPGELFARLGLEIRRRSPFRHTCIIGLANAYLGYIPDRKAYADGGYQTWAAWQSAMEVGTGEAIVDKAVAMLDELYDAAPPQRHGA